VIEHANNERQMLDVITV